MPITLHPLVGTNPLGLLAALGVFDVLDRRGVSPTLRWTPDLRPRAVIDGVVEVDELIDHLDADRQRWVQSPLLNWRGDNAPPDLKVSADDVRSWARAVLDEGERADQDLFCALLAEGALAGRGDSKPTHLHFTAGQQKFLVMVRELLSAIGPDELREAVVGPWTYESTLPTFAWDARGERSYALRATDPAKEQRPGIPGADWLAFLGLTFFPVVNDRGALVTRGCARPWKRSWLSWPLWETPLSRAAVVSLLADRTLATQPLAIRRACGIFEFLRAPIRRTDQGGYGSFGAAMTVLPRDESTEAA